MGLLDGFERRTEGVVQGVFARVFRSRVEPVEVASALRREAHDQRAVVSSSQVLVPNLYVVSLSTSDYDRLSPYEVALARELVTLQQEVAAEEGWTVPGPLEVLLEHDPALVQGVLRVRSEVRSSGRPPAPAPRPARPRPPSAPAATAALPALRYELEVSSPGGDTVYAVVSPVVSIGRGDGADLRLRDQAVSRLHGEVRLEGAGVVYRDSGSRNGSLVNGRRVTEAPLAPGDVVQVGTSRLVLRRR